MRDKLQIVCFQYNNAPAPYKRQVKELIQLIWPRENEGEVHSSEFNTKSFAAYLNEQIIGYAGVIQWPLHIKNETYKMCGLSCVCTHPQYRGQGIGSIIIQEATNWIMNEKTVDVGLFTCSPEHTHFYEHTHIWKKDKSLILQESCREGAYISTHLEVDVLKTLISDKAKHQYNNFQNTTIVLNFPKGEFI